MRSLAPLLTTLTLLAACGPDADAPPTGRTMPTKAELLAATPGGTFFDSIDTPAVQIDHPLPSFLFGDRKQVACGISTAIEGRDQNPDGGTPVRRQGLWHYFYFEGAAPPPIAERTRPAQRGAFRDGTRIGRWQFWHPDGSLRATGSFVDGKMHGAWQVYAPDGTPDERHSGRYEQGVRVE